MYHIKKLWYDKYLYITNKNVRIINITTQLLIKNRYMIFGSRWLVKQIEKHIYHHM